MSFRRAEFEDLAPDYEALERSDKTGKILEVIVTMKGCKDITDKNGTMYEYVSRNFSPWVGIPEDPVTGKTSFNHPYPTPEPKLWWSLQNVRTPFSIGTLESRFEANIMWSIHKLRN